MSVLSIIVSVALLVGCALVIFFNIRAIIRTLKKRQLEKKEKNISVSQSTEE